MYNQKVNYGIQNNLVLHLHVFI